MATGASMAGLLERPRAWTVDELHEVLAAIEADTGNDVDYRRFEIIDGSLVMSPPAAPRHEFLTSRLIIALGRTMVDGYEIVPAVGVDLAPSYLIPDLLVVPSTRFDSDVKRLPPSDPLLVVEIVSPGSTTMDRVTKPSIYAAAGIAHYWRVEARPAVTISVYDLDGASYREVGTWGPGETLTLDQPFHASLSLDDLNR